MAGKCPARIQRVKDELSSYFDIKDLGKMSYFLGMTIIQNSEKKEIWMGQPAYTRKLLVKHGMNECKPIGTPVDPGSHLTRATEEETAVNQQLYLSLTNRRSDVPVNQY